MNHPLESTSDVSVTAIQYVRPMKRGPAGRGDDGWASGAAMLGYMHPIFFLFVAKSDTRLKYKTHNDEECLRAKARPAPLVTNVLCITGRCVTLRGQKWTAPEWGEEREWCLTPTSFGLIYKLLCVQVERRRRDRSKMDICCRSHACSTEIQVISFTVSFGQQHITTAVTTAPFYTIIALFLTHTSKNSCLLSHCPTNRGSSLVKQSITGCFEVGHPC